VEDVRELARPLREQIVDALGEECAARGLKSNSEPNPYGLELEALTDACGLAWNDRAEHARSDQQEARFVEKQRQQRS
jgi:hypothetical protein